MSTPSSSSSSPSSTSVQILNPPSNRSLAETYSQISIVPLSSTKRLISFAGQTGTSKDSNDNAKLSFAEQIRLALEKVDKNLAAVGASKKDIVMIRPYVVKLTSRSAEEIKAKDEIFLKWWRSTEGDRLTPPDSLLGVDSLWSKETLFEIEVQCVADI
ncbi:Putative YjgF/YER057c/UK114 family, RutC-like superfamily protein [Septoria linicola]|uniref:YjgF/YER057c/UK114 family, RutC-like superfamily protein n=1 Tax=Septoria linicola TaxID=215465 RepID=A0A9Q9B094_9PEZI|nr:putative YjgF/YER057c/UK114 family, RutC-like superfamily protein [Septoria linicola]USW56513.1 Putative YjgF/YER057c/UK114 family, RutC-like superfamily protein [Septoria linicola]